MGKHHITPRLRLFKPRSRLFLANLLWGKGSRGMGWRSPSELSWTLSWENVLHLHLVQQSNQWSIGSDCWFGKLCLFWLSYFCNLTLTLKLRLFMGSPRFPDQCAQKEDVFYFFQASLQGEVQLQEDQFFPHQFLTPIESPWWSDRFGHTGNLERGRFLTSQVILLPVLGGDFKPLQCPGAGCDFTQQEVT